MNDDAKGYMRKGIVVKTAIIKKLVAYPEYHDISAKGQNWLEHERLQQVRLLQEHQISNVAAFPMKLYHMMEQSTIAGMTNIVTFQPHGRAIRIVDREQFRIQILSQHFPDNKNIESFLRQLNIYGFLRMTRNGLDLGSYYHEMFLAGRPDICGLIKRPTKSLHSKRQLYDATTEPNFYDMAPIHLPSTRQENCCQMKTRPRDELLENNTEANVLNKVEDRSNCTWTEQERNMEDDDTKNIPCSTIDGPFVAYNSLFHQNRFDNSNTVSVPSSILRLDDTGRNGRITTLLCSMVSDQPILSFLLPTKVSPRGNYGGDQMVDYPTSNFTGTNGISPADIVNARAASILAANGQQLASSPQPTVSMLNARCQNLLARSAATAALCHSRSYPMLPANTTKAMSLPICRCSSNNLATAQLMSTYREADDIEGCYGFDLPPLPLKKKMKPDTERKSASLEDTNDCRDTLPVTTHDPMNVVKNENIGDDTCSWSSSSRTSGSGMARFLGDVDLESSDDDTTVTNSNF